MSTGYRVWIELDWHSVSFIVSAGPQNIWRYENGTSSSFDLEPSKKKKKQKRANRPNKRINGLLAQHLEKEWKTKQFFVRCAHDLYECCQYSLLSFARYKVIHLILFILLLHASKHVEKVFCLFNFF